MKKKTKVACLIAIGAYAGYSLLPHHSELENKSTLEDVMEMQIPNYKVKQYIADPIIDFHGDYSDKIIIEFDTSP